MLGGFCRGSESFGAYVFLNHQILTPGLCAQKSVKTKETDMSPACPDNSPLCRDLEASPVIGSDGHNHVCVACYMADGACMAEILFLASVYAPSWE